MPAMMWEGRGEVARKPTRKLQRAENLLRGASCSLRQQPSQAGRVSCYLRNLKKAHSVARQPGRMVPGMTGQFYDKVTKKFGTFQGVPRPLTTYPQGNPEEMFEQKLFELSGKDKVALDLGCGDGRFTLRMAVYFREIVGIDSSVKRLKLAQAEQHVKEQNKARLEQKDDSRTNVTG